MMLTGLTAIVPLRYTLETLDQIDSTIAKCKKSLVRLIVVVDKHSTDSDNPVMDEWVNEVSTKVEVLQGNYSGPGTARNAGLEKFKENPSRWLAFWDADDSPSVGEIASVIEVPELADKKMIIGNFTISDTFNSSERKRIYRTKTPQIMGIQGGFWRIIFNFELIEKFPEFPNVRMGEDQVFLSRLVFEDDEIEFLDNHIYTYRIHSENQLMNSVAANSEVCKALEVVCQDIQNGQSRNSISNIVFANLVFSMILKRNWDRTTINSVLVVLKQNPSMFISMIRTFYVKLSLTIARPKSTYVFLTGGLGNQLFQLASAMKNSKGPVVGITTLGSQYRGGEIDVEKFEFPFSNVTFRKLKRNLLLIKAFNLGIRLSIRKTWLEKLSITRFLIRLFLAIFFVAYFKERVVVNISEGVSGLFEGYKNHHSVLIGYFQNFKNFNDSKSGKALRDCQLRNVLDQQALEEFQERAVLKMPCIIHVRQGDYLSSPDFHNLSKNYYSEALHNLSSECKFSEIWLFSDEPTKAIEFIPTEFQGKLYIPAIPIENSSLTLEVMKLGECYIIANSTFSWWAAFLRKNLSARVIAPKIWFVNDSISRPSYPTDWQIL